VVLPPGIKKMQVEAQFELGTEGMERAAAAFERIGEGLAAVSDAAQQAAAAFDLEQSISANAIYVGGDAAVTDVVADTDGSEP